MGYFSKIVKKNKRKKGLKYVHDMNEYLKGVEENIKKNGKSINFKSLDDFIEKVILCEDETLFEDGRKFVFNTADLFDDNELNKVEEAIKKSKVYCWNLYYIPIQDEDGNKLMFDGKEVYNVQVSCLGVFNSEELIH